MRQPSIELGPAASLPANHAPSLDPSLDPSPRRPYLCTGSAELRKYQAVYHLDDALFVLRRTQDRVAHAAPPRLPTPRRLGGAVDAAPPPRRLSMLIDFLAGRGTAAATPSAAAARGVTSARGGAWGAAGGGGGLRSPLPRGTSPLPRLCGTFPPKLAFRWLSEQMRRA